MFWACAARPKHPAPLFIEKLPILVSICGLIVALGVARFILVRESRNTWVFLIFLVSGLFIVAYPASYFTAPVGYWLSNITLVQMDPRMYLYSSGGFVAGIGGLGLVLRGGKIKEMGG